MASESYEFNPNFSLTASKDQGQPKALSWDPEKVQKWFNEAVKLKQYETLFIEHQIDGDMLFELTDENLQEIVSIGIHRSKILKAIKKEDYPGNLLS